MMKKNIIEGLDKAIYWLIIFLPFSIAIAPAPMNVFMGMLIAFFLIKKILKKEHLFTKTAINIPLLLLFVITCLSIVNTISLADTLKGGIFKLLRYIFVFFIMVQELKDKSHVRKIVISMMLGLVFVSLDGIWQLLTGKDFVRGYEPILNIGLLRATASFKDANTFGIYLSALAPVIFGLTLYYYTRHKKLLHLFISILVMIGIILTYSRPTLLAVYLALLFLGIAKKDKILLAILILTILISPFIAPRSVKDWVKACNYNPLRVMCNDDRIAIFRNSINMIKGHPVIGVGANTFMKNYKRYKEVPEWKNIVTSDYCYAHNNFLHMGAEIGFIGLGFFIWLLYKLFSECRYIYISLKEDYLKVVSLSLTACLLAFLVNGLTESSLYYSRVAVLFWYLTGFSLSLKKFASL